MGLGPKLPVVEELHRPRISSFAGAEEFAGDGSEKWLVPCGVNALCVPKLWPVEQLKLHVSFRLSTDNLESGYFTYRSFVQVRRCLQLTQACNAPWFCAWQLSCCGQFLTASFQEAWIWIDLGIISASDRKRSQIQVLQILVRPVGDLSQKAYLGRFSQADKRLLFRKVQIIDICLSIVKYRSLHTGA